MRRLLCALAMVGASSAFGQGDTGGLRPDRRIQYVTYDSDEVVTVEAVVGVVTHIVLEAGESYVTHAFGDGKAWDFAVKGNHYFLKAVAANADSNLTVVTDRRSYHFGLRLATGADAPATFEVVFRYPDSDARKKREATRRRELDEAFARRGERPNLAYTMSGDLDIAPLNAWDDGTFTYFKFAGNRDIPAIYVVDAEGAESIVNRHSTGPANDIVVVHKVAARWVFRLGTRALAVWNDVYDADGRRNVTGTASPDVKRVLWK
jgi:type IV secretion system protein VirB9